MDWNRTSHCMNVAAETFLRGDGRYYTFYSREPQGEYLIFTASTNRDLINQSINCLLFFFSRD